MKTITESLNELFAVCEKITEIMQLNSVKSHYRISHWERSIQTPIVSEIGVNFYQPADSKKYSLRSEYTHITISKNNMRSIEIGKYGCVSYDLSLNLKDIDNITKEVKKIYEEFKDYNFSAEYNKRLIILKQDLKSLAFQKKEINNKIKEQMELLNKVKS